MKSEEKNKNRKRIFFLLLAFPWMVTFFLGVSTPFRCTASFISGILFCVFHLGLIYWSWIYLLSRKKLVFWGVFLVLKYGLVFLILYWLLSWIYLLYFSGGFILQGSVMVALFLFFKKRMNGKSERSLCDLPLHGGFPF